MESSRLRLHRKMIVQKCPNFPETTEEETFKQEVYDKPIISQLSASEVVSIKHLVQ